MELFLKILVGAGMIILATFLSLQKKITRKVRVIIWLVVAGIIISQTIVDIIQALKEKAIEQERIRDKIIVEEIYGKLCRSAPPNYVDGLPTSPDSVVRDLFYKGRKYQEERKFNQAIEYFKKCLQLESTTPDNKVALHLLIGGCYYELYVPKEAERNFREGLKISKRIKDKVKRLEAKAAALEDIGIVHAIQLKYDKAIKAYKKAISIYEENKMQNHPKYALCQMNLGEVYRDTGKKEDALRCLELALRIFKETLPREHPWYQQCLKIIESTLINQGAKLNR